MPIARLTMLLRGETHRTVLDKTGLDGSYDFKLEYASSLRKGDASPELGESVFAAVRKLGLKLEAQKGSSEHLVIERWRSRRRTDRSHRSRFHRAGSALRRPTNTCLKQFLLGLHLLGVRNEIQPQMCQDCR
jgi:hypothetical protein